MLPLYCGLPFYILILSLHFGHNIPSYVPCLPFALFLWDFLTNQRGSYINRLLFFSIFHLVVANSSTPLVTKYLFTTLLWFTGSVYIDIFAFLFTAARYVQQKPQYSIYGFCFSTISSFHILLTLVLMWLYCFIAFSYLVTHLRFIILHSLYFIQYSINVLAQHQVFLFIVIMSHSHSTTHYVMLFKNSLLYSRSVFRFLSQFCQ